MEEAMLAEQQKKMIRKPFLPGIALAAAITETRSRTPQVKKEPGSQVESHWNPTGMVWEKISGFPSIPSGILVECCGKRSGFRAGFTRILTGIQQEYCGRSLGFPAGFHWNLKISSGFWRGCSSESHLGFYSRNLKEKCSKIPVCKSIKCNKNEVSITRFKRKVLSLQLFIFLIPFSCLL